MVINKSKVIASFILIFLVATTLSISISSLSSETDTPNLFKEIFGEEENTYGGLKQSENIDFEESLFKQMSGVVDGK